MTEPTVPETAIAQIEHAAVGAKQRRESVSTTDYLVASPPDIAPPIYRAMIICSMALQYRGDYRRAREAVHRCF